MRFMILFSKSGANGDKDDFKSITRNKIFMNSGDMKKLKVRMGGYVYLDIGILVRVWQSKKSLPAGSATLNRIWMPNFANGRDVEVTSINIDR